MQKKRMPSRARIRPFFVPRIMTTLPRIDTFDVAGLDARQLDQDADRLAVVERRRRWDPRTARRRAARVVASRRRAAKRRLSSPCRRESSTIGP